MDLEGRLRLIELHIGDPTAHRMPADAAESVEFARLALGAASSVLEANQRLRNAGLTLPLKLSIEIDRLAEVLALGSKGS